MKTAGERLHEGSRDPIVMATAQHPAPAARRASSPRLLGPGLLTVAVLSLAGAGLLLWRWQGDAVFGQYLLGALAWCF